MNQNTHSLGKFLDNIDSDFTKEILKISKHNMINGIIYQSLIQSKVSKELPLMNELKNLSVISIYSNLKKISEIVYLKENFFDPFDINYAVVKGPAFLGRYYPSLDQRSSRDLDILLPRNRMLELIERLFEVGYQWVDDGVSGPRPPNWDFLIQAEPEIILLSPRGVIVELHSELDLKGRSFPTDKILRTTTRQKIGSHEFSVLPQTYLFTYICYHHSRHYWSRLHWVADLVRIMQDPDFDRSEVLKVATQVGFAGLVEKCMLLPEMLNSQSPASSRTMARMCRNYCSLNTVPPEQHHHELLQNPIQHILLRSRLFVEELHSRDVGWKLKFVRETLFRPSYQDLVYADLWLGSPKWASFIRPIRVVYTAMKARKSVNSTKKDHPKDG